MTFLFWNLNRGGLPRSVARLALDENVDVLILAECTMRWSELLWELNAESPDYHFADGNCGHIVFFTRFHPSLFPPRIESHDAPQLPQPKISLLSVE